MLLALCLAASFVSLPLRGAQLVDSAIKALESGFLEGHTEEVQTIIVARERFLPRVRKLGSLPNVNLEFVVGLRAECKDTELRPWCLDRALHGSVEERRAAMRGLYLVGTQEDVPVIMAGLAHEESARWAALALGRLKAREAIPLLIVGLGRSSPSGAANSAPPGALTLSLGEACRNALQGFGPEIVSSILPVIHPGSDAGVVIGACQIVRRFRDKSACEQVYNLARVRHAQLQANKKPRSELYMEMRELVLTLQQFSDARAEPFVRALASTDYAADRSVGLEPDPTSTLARMLSKKQGNGLGRDVQKVLNHEPNLAAAFIQEHFHGIAAEFLPELLDRLMRSAVNEDDQFRIFALAAHSDDSKVREYAVHGFGTSLRPESRSYLLRLMMDKDPLVRRRARDLAAIVIGVPMALSR